MNKLNNRLSKIDKSKIADEQNRKIITIEFTI